MPSNAGPESLLGLILSLIAGWGRPRVMAQHYDGVLPPPIAVDGEVCLVGLGPGLLRAPRDFRK